MWFDNRPQSLRLRNMGETSPLCTLQILQTGTVRPSAEYRSSGATGAQLLITDTDIDTNY